MRVVTPQETFDVVARHLLKQDRRATTPQGVCRYRGVDDNGVPNGTSCAVGCLIPDKDYHLAYEGTDLRGVFFAVPALQRHDYKLLSSLQGIHDGWPVEEWRQQLEVLAKIQALKFPEKL